MKLRLSPSLLALTLIFMTLIVTFILELVGVISMAELVYQNFDVFIFALVFISLLSIIGAIFLGMFISNKLMSISGFTPFEEEMLKMRKDIKDIKSTLKNMDDIKKD